MKNTLIPLLFLAYFGTAQAQTQPQTKADSDPLTNPIESARLKKTIESTLRKNYRSIADSLQKNYGITISKVNFGLKDQKLMKHEANSFDVAGTYDFMLDSTQVDPTPKKNNKILGYLRKMKDSQPSYNSYLRNAEGNLIHQLGHDYFYQEALFLAEKGTLHTDFLVSEKLNSINVQLLKEGLAYYFQNRSLRGSAADLDLSAGLDAHVNLYKSRGTSTKFILEKPGKNNLPILYEEIGARIIGDIFQSLGPKQGLLKILTSAAPSDGEIENPEKYVHRIIKN